MIFTNEELAQIQEYASMFLYYNEIAVLLNKEVNEFETTLKDKHSPAYTAYQKGKAQSKVEVRKNILKLAKNGNVLAEQLVNKYIIDQEIKEI